MTSDIRAHASRREPFGLHLFSSFLGNLVLPIFYIFLPLFAVKIGAGPLEVGLVGGVANGVYAFMPFVMGHFSDRRGSRMFFIASSFAVLTIVSLSYSLVVRPATLIVLRVFEGIGWAMLWPALEAGITADASRDSRRSLSIFNLTWSAGACAGPAVGTALIVLGSYHLAFQATAGVLAICLAANLYSLAKNRTSNAAEQAHPPMSQAVREVFSGKNPPRAFQVRFSVAAIALSSVSSGVLFTFFGPYAKNLGISLTVIGTITFAYGVARLATYFATTRTTVRNRLLTHRNMATLLALIIVSLSSLLLLFRDSTTILYFVSFGLVAFAYSVIYAIGQVTMIAEASPSQMGAGAGVFESSIGLGAAVGPIIGGAISGPSFALAFLVPPAGLLVVGLITSILFRSRN